MSAYQAAKDGAKILMEAGKIEEYTQILELIGEIREVSDRNHELKNALRNLQEKLDAVADHLFRDNAYWHKETGDGPFCSRCFDVDRRMVRIIPLFVGHHVAQCPQCKNEVNTTGNVPVASAQKNRGFDPYSPI